MYLIVKEEIDYLKSWIANRLAWMDSQILLLNIDNSTMLSNVNLSHAYPNPFNPDIYIQYKLELGGNVFLNIYDILGNNIKTLVSEYKPVGNYISKWDATNENGEKCPSGQYFYQLQTSDIVQTKRMILLK